jgi:hypothetical protein
MASPMGPLSMINVRRRAPDRCTLPSRGVLALDGHGRLERATRGGAGFAYSHEDRGAGKSA